MPVQSHIQTNFTAGELSPRLGARIDISKYNNGCSRLENFLIHPHGGISRRGGSEYIADVKEHDKTVRLIPFEFSTEQTYILEFGDQYMRIFKEGGHVPKATTVTGATQANPCAITCPGHAFTNGDVVTFEGVEGMTELNSGSYTATFIEEDLIFLEGIDATGFGAYTGGGVVSGGIYAISTPYPEADLMTIDYAQSADVLYLAHGNHPPQKLSRTGDSAWTLEEVLVVDGPYQEINTDVNSMMAPSAMEGNITIIALGHRPFTEEMIGDYVRILHNDEWGSAQITELITDRSVYAKVIDPFHGTGYVVDWKMGAWGAERGFPRTVTFYEQRLVWGGSKSEPQTIWMSQSGDYENMSPGNADAADAMTYTIATDQVNAIRWMSPGKVLMVGTNGGEFIVSASSTSDALAPDNIRVVRHANFGSSEVRPARVGEVMIYNQRYGREVRQLAYQYEADSYVSPDLTLLSEHITKGGVRDMAYAQGPDSILWCARNDGQLLGLTYEKNQDVVGWHRHTLGGSDAAVESVAVIPGAERSELWMSVSRTIDGSTRRSIERLHHGMDIDEILTDARFLDGFLVYSGVPVTEVSGLEHLEGETVSIVADGSAVADQVVASGSITLATAAATVVVGLGYDSTMETMNIEAGSADGTAQGKKKRVHEAILSFYRTVNAQVGPSTETLDTVIFSNTADPLGAPPPLFSGDKLQTFPSGYNREARVVVRQNQPMPMTLLSVVAHVKTNG
ncbi:MAG: hypothetical protein HQL50_13440 [Magnetococcales bacterium]|nr:hypothetical protein [Magnetococcales bacterium]